MILGMTVSGHLQQRIEVLKMARCDEGYRCEVCGGEVAMITESDLYLRYVLGEIPLEQLHRHPERHIRCNPFLAQFIADPAYADLVVEGHFSRAALDPEFVRQEEERVTRAWKRLQELPRLGLSLPEYPLTMVPAAEQEQ